MAERLLKWLTPGDKLLILFLLLLSAASFWLIRVTSPAGTSVEVWVQGKIIARLPLNEDRQFVVKGVLGPSIIRIHQGQVSFENSACPNQLCTRMGTVFRAGQILVCLPNQVWVQVSGNQTSFDLITE